MQLAWSESIAKFDPNHPKANLEGYLWTVGYRALCGEVGDRVEEREHIPTVSIDDPNNPWELEGELQPESKDNIPVVNVLDEFMDILSPIERRVIEVARDEMSTWNKRDMPNLSAIARIIDIKPQRAIAAYHRAQDKIRAYMQEKKEGDTDE